jgi:hypothetical protein
MKAQFLLEKMANKLLTNGHGQRDIEAIAAE